MIYYKCNKEKVITKKVITNIKKVIDFIKIIWYIINVMKKSPTRWVIIAPVIINTASQGCKTGIEITKNNITYKKVKKVIDNIKNICYN